MRLMEYIYGNTHICLTLYEKHEDTVMNRILSFLNVMITKGRGKRRLPSGGDLNTVLKY